MIRRATANVVLVLACAVVVSVEGFAPIPAGIASQHCQNTLPQHSSSVARFANNNPLDSLLDAIGGLTSAPSPKQEEEEETSLPDVVIEPDFRLAAIFLTLGLFLDTVPYLQLVLGPLITVLGLLFLVQTFRIRFTFDTEAFELKQGDDLDETGDNIIVGGANRWTYDSFVNYDFFPKGWIDQPQGPILVYFKETQTPSDLWNEGPGQSANSPEAIANGAVPGQVHFFPALCNTQQLRAEFQKRKCAKL